MHTSLQRATRVAALISTRRRPPSPPPPAAVVSPPNTHPRMEGPGWRVGQLGARGRGVVATRTFQPGDCVLSDAAFAWALFPDRAAGFCDCCLAPADSPLRCVPPMPLSMHAGAGVVASLPCMHSMRSCRPDADRTFQTPPRPSPSAAPPASSPAMLPRSTRPGRGARAGTAPSAQRCAPARRACRPPLSAWRCAACCGGGPRSRVSSRRAGVRRKWRAWNITGSA